MGEWLTADQQRAWRAYRRMVLLVDSVIARELTRDTGLSMPDYQVLSTLSEAPGHRRRLTELAGQMQWSPSRLSHHVTRMEQRRLVTRADCTEDLRAAYVELTHHGWDAIRSAAPAHVASVRSHLIELLDADDVAALTAIGEKVAKHFGDNCIDTPATVEPSDSAADGSQTAADQPGGAADQPAGQSAKRSPVNRS